MLKTRSIKTPATGIRGIDHATAKYSDCLDCSLRSATADRAVSEVELPGCRLRSTATGKVPSDCTGTTVFSSMSIDHYHRTGELVHVRVF